MKAPATGIMIWMKSEDKRSWLDRDLTMVDFKRSISGFHQDELGDWVAELACGDQRRAPQSPLDKPSLDYYSSRSPEFYRD